MERRHFYRVSPHMDVRLEPDGRGAISGHIENVSLQGILVACGASLPTGSTCRVHISLGVAEEAASIRGRATIVRMEARGLAMQFTELDDPESYRHLRNLVTYNADDPERVDQEIERWLPFRPTNGAH